MSPQQSVENAIGITAVSVLKRHFYSVNMIAFVTKCISQKTLEFVIISTGAAGCFMNPIQVLTKRLVC